MTRQHTPKLPKPTQAERERYTQVILEHKRLVARYMQEVIAALVERAAVHDNSKFGPDEFDPYAANLSMFEAATYGSEDYIAACRRIKPAIRHHVTTNRHHPEYFTNGINGMTLIDLVEMVCDWIAASQRVPGGSIHLDVQRNRFDIEPQLMHIIEQTVDVLMPPQQGEGASHDH